MRPSKTKILNWFEAERQKLLEREAKALREKEALDLARMQLLIAIDLREISQPVPSKFDVENLLEQIRFYQIDLRVRNLLEQDHNLQSLPFNILQSKSAPRLPEKVGLPDAKTLKVRH